MKGKFKKLISFAVSALMALSLVTVRPVSAVEKSDVTKNVSEALKQQVRQAYKKSLTNVKDLKSKYDYFNDNVDNLKKVDPDEDVRLIVELDEKAVKDFVPKGKKLSEAANNKALLNKVEDLRDPYEAKVKQIDDSINIRNRYSVLLNGFSLEAKNKDIEEIKKIPGVKHVTVAKKYYPDMNYAKDLTNATSAWEDYGLKGEGMVVAIIDTGIDVTHKDMRLSDPSKAKLTKDKIDKILDDKGKFYTDKVPYGYNFADQNDVIKDTTSSMHGMHVAGIVGANCESDEDVKQDKGVRGVAPECQLLAMKVFSNDPNNVGAFSDDIVAAIEDSVKHEADVINMSLGSTAAFQDPEDAEQKAIKEAVDHGVAVVVSAGNSEYSTSPLRLPGVEDTGLVGSPGLAEDSLQVASYENNKATAAAIDYSYEDDGETKTGLVPYTTSEVDPVGVLNGEYELVDCGFGTVDDFEGKDVKGKVALIKRGALSFVEKKMNAQNAGAVGAIVYNADGDDTFINMATDPAITIPGVFIRNCDGVMLKENLEKGLKVSFNGTPCATDNAAAKHMSDFTSWGPTPNLDFKPEITAPGGQIWSTVNDNKYQSMSGTSMASPHMAGCMALIMQHVDEMVEDKKISFDDEREKVEFAKALACNTAQVMLDDSTEANLPYSPRRQGAGMVDVKAAMKNNVTVTYNGKPVAALKEIGNLKKFKLKLHNYGDTDVTYDVKPLNDNVLTDYYGFLQGMSFEQVIDGSSVEVDKDKVTVKAGEDAEVEVTLSIPNDSELYNVFAEGFVRFIPENNEDNKVPEVGVPFMGFYGEWDEEDIIDAPAWSNETWIGYTQLLTYIPGEDGGYYTVGKTDENGNTSDPDTIAISNSGYGNDNILPLLTLFRNAKQMKVEIVDSEGNVIKTVANNVNVRKNVFSDPNDPWYKIIDNAIWDGTVYDPSTGRNVPVEDGQYYVRIESCIDYPDAKMQQLDMPVKVDSVEPTVSIPFFTDLKVNEDGTYACTLTFEADDNNGVISSGLSKFAFAVDGELYEDGEGNLVLVDPEDIKNEDGTYSITLNLDQEPLYVDVLALDYAGNLGDGFTITIPDSIEITSPEDGALLENSFDVDFTVPDDVVAAADRVDVMVDGEKIDEVALEDGKNEYEYQAKDLEEGKHEMELVAVKSGAEGEEDLDVAYGWISFTVKSNELGLTFDTLQSGMITNETDYYVSGSVTTMPDVFTINGVDMLQDAYWYGGDFETYVYLEPGKLNKVAVYAKKGDVEYNYSYEVYCDNQAPVVTMTRPVFEEGENSATVVVPKDTEKYTVKGTVQDDTFGYTLFINGDAVETVSLNVPDPEKTVRTFEKEVALAGDTTVITIQAVDEASNDVTKTVKVVKEKDEEEGSIDINPFGFDESYKNGDIINGGIQVTNNYVIPKPVAMIVGVFDKNTNEMVTSAIVSKTIGVGEQGKENIAVQLPIPQEGEYVLRCFVWDTLGDMEPISELIEMAILQPEPEETENPEQPGNPEDPGDVVEPENPENPEIPGDGSSIEEPANPSDPVDEEQPENPTNPEDPGDTDAPEEPVNP